MLYGSADIKKLAKKAKELGQDTIALTDYGNLYNAINFYRAATDEGVKPVLGVTVLFCEDAAELKVQKSRRFNHLVLLAENDIGWKNITRIVSASNDKDHYFYVPRVDFNLLSQHAEGVIALTGSTRDGVIPFCLFDKTDDHGALRDPAAPFKAEALIRRFLKIYDKDHFYLEVQDTGDTIQPDVNDKLRKLAGKYGLKTVATNNVHYVAKSDAEAHRTLLDMEQNQYNRTTRTDFSAEECYLKDVAELTLEEAELAMANSIGDRCTVTIDLKKHRLPKYRFVPEGVTSVEYMRKLAADGFVARGLNSRQNITDYELRLERELQDIEDMGFADYFLIVHDVVDWCHQQDILLGFGRGSAGGSLVSYCLGITDIDPLEYGLIWERFLNKGRGGLPDIDTDVPRSRRQEVLAYIRERFGERNVAQLVTLSGMHAKGILKEVFKLFNMPFEESNRITSLVPAKNEDHVQVTLSQALEMVPELKKYQEKYKAWFELALSLEGCYKTTGLHAAAVVISDIPFDESSYPLSRDKNGNPIFGWDMDTVDALHLLKLDILGLSTLDDIQVTRELVRERRGIDLTRENMQLDNAAAYALMGQGWTIGVFQIEKQLGRTWSKNLQPGNVEEVSDLVSLIRPGPMDSGMHTKYQHVKDGSEAPSYIHASLEPILQKTYSGCLYQEQVIEICKRLAGMSLVDADKVRKAMGKKKPAEMAKWRQVFVDGCTNNSIDIVTAEEIWGYIETFAGYGFNKSHGVGYGLLAYETAYLKANYTVEFLCAKLRHAQNDPDKFEKINQLVYDAKLFGITVTPPRVKRAGAKVDDILDFSILDDDRIAFGITSLKGVGVTAARKVISVAKSSDNLYNIFWQATKKKSGVSSAVIEALIRSGAFDEMAGERVRMEADFNLVAALTPGERTTLEALLDAEPGSDWVNILRAIADEEKSVQVKERYGVKIPNAARRPRLRGVLSDYDRHDLFDNRLNNITWERQYLGVSLSGTEADVYRSKNKCVDLVKHGQPGMDFEISVCLDSVRQIFTKTKGEPMAFVTGRDNTHSLDGIVVFPKVYHRCSRFLEPGNVVKIRGEINDRGSYIANRLERLA